MSYSGETRYLDFKLNTLPHPTILVNHDFKISFNQYNLADKGLLIAKTILICLAYGMISANSKKGANVLRKRKGERKENRKGG